MALLLLLLRMSDEKIKTFGIYVEYSRCSVYFRSAVRRLPISPPHPALDRSGTFGLRDFKKKIIIPKKVKKYGIP